MTKMTRDLAELRRPYIEAIEVALSHPMARVGRIEIRPLAEQ